MPSTQGAGYVKAAVFLLNLSAIQFNGMEGSDETASTDAFEIRFHGIGEAIAADTAFFSGAVTTVFGLVDCARLAQ